MTVDTDKEVAAAILAALLKERVTHLEEHLDSMRIALEKEINENTQKITKLEQDRDNALKWGIMLLGTAVMNMGTWIFNLFSERFKF